MQILQSLTINIAPNTAISSYRNGEKECCVFMKDGETVSLTFDINCLNQITELITQLQQMQQTIVVAQQTKLSQEIKLLNNYNQSKLLLPSFIKQEEHSEFIDF